MPHSTTPAPTRARGRRRREKPKPLTWVLRRCRHAPAVWLALAGLSHEAGSPVVCTSRRILALVSGIRRHNTISAALTVLHQAHWITRILVGREQDGRRMTLLKIVVNRDAVLASLLCNNIRRTYRATKTVAHGVQQKTLHDSLKREGAGAARSRGGAAPSLLARAGLRPSQNLNPAQANITQTQTPSLDTKPSPLTADGIPVAIAEMQRQLREKAQRAKEEIA